jgi:putative transposase
MCKVLKVSTSGYYNWLKAKVSKLWLYNQKLSELITAIFKDSCESYGAPRIKKHWKNSNTMFPDHEWQDS